MLLSACYEEEVEILFKEEVEISSKEEVEISLSFEKRKSLPECIEKEILTYKSNKTCIGSIC